MANLKQQVTEDMLRRVQEARKVSRAQARWLIESYLDLEEEPVQCCSVPYEVRDAQPEPLDEIVDRICRQDTSSAPEKQA